MRREFDNLRSWRLTTLGEVCGKRSGLQTGPFGSQLHAGEYTETGLPVVMPKDLVNGKIVEDQIARIPHERAERLSRHFLTEGDILFSRRGDVCRSALVTPKEHGWICGTGCLRARPDGSVCSEFLFHCLQTYQLRGWLENNAVGQTMPNLSTSILMELPLHLPPVPEQNKIAGILSTWDRAIDLTDRLIAAKEKQKKALMQQLLTGKRRFKEFAGEGWREARLGDLFSERNEIGHNGLPLVAITGKEGIVYRDTLDRRDTSNEDKSKYLRICKGDIGYNTMRMWQGVSGVSEVEGIVSPAYTICTPKKAVDPYFMGYLFKYTPVVHLFLRFSQGLVKDTLNLKFREFSQIKVSVPSYEEQQQISGLFRQLDRHIALLKRESDALKNQKKALMQQLLTGKLRVRVDDVSQEPQQGQLALF